VNASLLNALVAARLKELGSVSMTTARKMGTKRKTRS
jgi:hypothetical protein